MDPYQLKRAEDRPDADGVYFTIHNLQVWVWISRPALDSMPWWELQLKLKHLDPILRAGHCVRMYRDHIELVYQEPISALRH